MTATTDVPAWLMAWFDSGDTGISSETIACVLAGPPRAVVMQRWPFDAPHDTSDVGRCVRLLEAAHAAGENWRARLDEVGKVCRAWAPLVPYWPMIEDAYRDDVRRQGAWRAAGANRPPRRRKGQWVYPKGASPCPPAWSYWIVELLRTGRDLYPDTPVPWDKRMLMDAWARGVL